jgi:light-regulated signal transduction histidine kinase (bacteriophytochrome)
MNNEDKTRDQLIEELKKKQREVEAMIAESEQYTYTIIHDLTNPLITIRGFITLLEKDMENGECKLIEQDMKHITTAATQMEEHLNSLMTRTSASRN